MRYKLHRFIFKSVKNHEVNVCARVLAVVESVDVQLCTERQLAVQLW